MDVRCITVEDCLDSVNGNRFQLIHLVVERIRQHRKGEPYLVKDKNREVVMTLREVAAGKVRVDNIQTLAAKLKKDKKTEAASEEDAKQQAPTA